MRLRTHFYNRRPAINLRKLLHFFFPSPRNARAFPESRFLLLSPRFHKKKEKKKIHNEINGKLKLISSGALHKSQNADEFVEKFLGRRLVERSLICYVTLTVKMR
jgi:hypothetical protein